MTVSFRDDRHRSVSSPENEMSRGGTVPPTKETIPPQLKKDIRVVVHTQSIETNMSSNTHPLVASPDLTFSWHMFVMLENSVVEGFDDTIVSWTSNHGNAFKVHNPETFSAADILPRFFQMKKYASFTRQLHAYSFTWIPEGSAKGGCKPSSSITFASRLVSRLVSCFFSLLLSNEMKLSS
jgi:hypothetical protein